MAISAEQLNVILSARDREFTRAMDRAQRRVDRFAQQSNRSLGRTSQSWAALAAQARAFLPALSAGVVIAQTRRVISELDEIGKTADSIGLTTDALQELRVVAEEAGVAQESLDNSMLQFSRRLGEAQQGLGQARYALEELNLTAGELTAMPLDEALQVVADRMLQVEDATARTALATQLFGRQGVGMLNLLREGAEGMEAMRQNARELGIVIDEDLIRGAEDAENQLGLMSRVINANLSEALVNLAPLLVAAAEGIAAISRAINALVDGALGREDVGEQIARLIQEQANLRMRMETAAAASPDARTNPALAAYQEQLEAVNRELNALVAAQNEVEGGGGAFQMDEIIFDNSDEVIEDIEEVAAATRTVADTAEEAADNFLDMFQTIIDGSPALQQLGFNAENLQSTMQTVESSMESAFMSMIDGTASAQDAFRAMAADIIRELYRVLVVQRLVGSFEQGGGGILGSIFGAMGGAPTNAASGRSVQSGRAYTVGEHGRELFVPSSAGRVLSVPQAKAAVGGGSGQQIVVNYSFQGGITEADLGRALPVLVERTKREVVDAVQRGGSVARVFR